MLGINLMSYRVFLAIVVIATISLSLSPLYLIFSNAIEFCSRFDDCRHAILNASTKRDFLNSTIFAAVISLLTTLCLVFLQQRRLLTRVLIFLAVVTALIAIGWVLALAYAKGYGAAWNSQ